VLAEKQPLLALGQLFGLSKKFWKWFHRKIKKKGEADLCKEEAEELHKEWKDAGEPGPDAKGGWDDLLDIIIPGPQFIFSPCMFNPRACGPTA